MDGPPHSARLDRSVVGHGSHPTNAEIYAGSISLAAASSDATVSRGKGSEPGRLAEMLEPDRLYVLDGGYFQYELLARILTAKSSFVARVQPQIAHQVQEVRELSPAKQA